MQFLIDLLTIISVFGVLGLLSTLILFSGTHMEPFTDFLFNNVQSGNRRNMSYDLRGDPYIPFKPVSPWNNPETFPIRNRQMIIADPYDYSD